jgi:hypothetical protein
MKIAIYKDDEKKVPYLVHFELEDEGLVSLGLRNYPDVEQDYYTEVSEIEYLKKGTDEYKQAKKEIKNKL